MKPKPFDSEVALCAAFIAEIDKRTWTPYAETAGWDILLVRKSDGYQIGIQAKLALNLDVINQAIEQHGGWVAAAEGPDCRAVLVPGGTSKLEHICDYVGLVVVVMQSSQYYSRPSFYPTLPERSDAWGSDDWHEWCPTKRHKLPEYVPDVAAGASAPLQLTDWKIKAIKLAVLLERNGFVTREDFKHLSLDHRRWIAQDWLVASPKGYIAGAAPNFKKQHPKVYAKIDGEFDRWKPPQSGLLLPAATGNMFARHSAD